MNYNIKKTISNGDRVTLVGLKTNRLNGKMGTIVSHPGSSNEGRYGIKVDGSKKLIAIKPENILITPIEMLGKGDRVSLIGLKSTALKGKKGLIVSLSDPLNYGRYGIRVDGTRNKIAVRPANIKPLATSTLELMKERIAINALVEPTNKRELMNADQITLKRLMMVSKDFQLALFGREIELLPDFPLEVINEGGGFPEGVDHVWANKYLRREYNSAAISPHVRELTIKKPDYKPDQKFLMKRLGFCDDCKWKWYCSGKPGHIFERKIVPRHTHYLRYSYSNQGYKKEELVQGTTHVAIGFVDLGLLMASNMERNGDEPLKFVGIDSSPYVVAKTLLIWELIALAGSTVNISEKESIQKYIAQVWFSTTWSGGTEAVVKMSLSSLLSSKEKELDTEVYLILQHWRGAPTIPLNEARAKHSLAKSKRSTAIGKLRKQQDRIATAKYVLTGDFCTHNPICGNFVLFDCPDGTPPAEMDETVFSALDFSAVMEIVKKNSQLTILDAAERHALSGIAKLVRWCENNQLSVELRCSRVENVIDDIAALKPWTMSWSNVLDYIDYHEFHQMARECSKHGDTVHFGYSMNWPTDVWGTSLIDYGDPKYRAEIIESSHEGCQDVFRRLGWENYFRFPLPQHTVNTAHMFLVVAYFNKWAEHFFSHARREGLSCHVGKVELNELSPLSKSAASTVSFTWTYDPGVVFSTRRVWKSNNSEESLRGVSEWDKKERPVSVSRRCVRPVEEIEK